VSRWLQSLLVMLMLPIGAVVAEEPLPDPTRPYDYAPEAPPPPPPEVLMEWRVSAIRIAATGRSAILNGRLVREGDQVGPGTVVGIRPGEVVLDYNGNQVTVSLLRGGFKRPAGTSDQEQTP